LYELIQEIVLIHTNSCMEVYKMAGAPRLQDDPKPMKTRRIVEEKTYKSDSPMEGASPGIEGKIKIETTDDPYLNKSKWKNRRQMAWVSLFALIGQMIASLALIALTDTPIEKLKVLIEMMSWPALAFASVIGAYMGFTTWAGRK